jgi:endoglucanase
MYRATSLAAITTLTIGGSGMAGELQGQSVRSAMAEPAAGVKEDAAADAATPQPPRVYFASPSVVGLRFETGRVVARGGQQPYHPEPGDRIGRDGTLVRDGRPLGLVVGRDRNVLFAFDRFVAAGPAPLLVEPGGGSGAAAAIDRKASYRLGSADDPAYVRPLAPLGVWRKSKVVDSARVGRSDYRFVQQHDVFLELPRPLKPGGRYSLSLAAGSHGPVELTYAPRTTLSEAVHVTQLGFGPDDPIKAAYLSLWRGENAEAPDGADGMVYDPSPAFRLVSESTGEVLREGVARLDAPAGEPTDAKRNYNLADVHVLDFSDFRVPGRYRVEVDGVGTSYPFEVGEGVWEKAFATSMRGLFHQRSGIALGEPHTSWTRPRSLSPSDGFDAYQSAATLMGTSMGLDLLNESSFEALVAGRSLETVPGAWGGWHDAGDFDRRIQHLWTAQRLLQLTELRPAFVERVDLRIPESGNALPDTVDEALWAVDLYRRLQKPDGGVPGGIEASGHPRPGEGSWLESQDLFVYAPDPWSSYVHAATAARAAHVLARYDPERAVGYCASAEAAMTWAERHRTGHLVDVPEIGNARNLAAAELYRLTGAAAWHEIYLASTSYATARAPSFKKRQHEAAFVYARLRRPVDGTVRANGIADVLRNADRLLAIGHRGGFGQTINPATPYGYGYTSVVPADADLVLIKAYELEGDPRFLRASFGDALFGLGANPDNLVYTTGLGARGPREVLVVDAEALGKEAPPGITIFGQYDAFRRGGHFSFKMLAPWSYPAYPWRWPLHEMVNGFRLSIPITEFSVNATLGPTAFVRGYLAATGPGHARGAGG